MHRIDEVHVRVFLAQVLHRGHHGDETFSKILPAVAGNQHEFLAVVKTSDIVTGILQDIDLLIGKGFVALEFIHYHVKGIDDGIAGDEDLAMGLFLQEVLLTERGRRKVVGGNASGNLTIHLLRPRTVNVVGSESGFDMANGDLLIEGRERSSGAGSRVAMDKDHIGLNFFQHITHPRKHASSDVIEVLPLLHDIQVIVGLNLKYLEHLVQHLAVLTGHANYRFKLIRMLLELLHQGAHLDGLWTGSENEHYFLHYCIFILVCIAHLTLIYLLPLKAFLNIS